MSKIKSEKAKYHLLELMYTDRMIREPQSVVFLSVAEDAVVFAEQDAKERARRAFIQTMYKFIGLLPVEEIKAEFMANYEKGEQ